MSGTLIESECPSCHAALRSLPEFAFCSACGLIITDMIRAADEIAAVRDKLTAAIAGDVSLDYPNTLATLNEGAWWQLSDGHAVHFTAGSLARFVRAERFDIVELSLSDDDGLFHLKATRAAAQSRPRFDIEDDLLAIAAGVEAFPASMERQVARWRRVIEEMLGEGRRLVVRGPGTVTSAFFAKLRIDESRVGRVIDASTPPDAVIALDDAVDEVRRELLQAGLRALVLTP
jgi:hypothetical protein